jgi:hypothetical protein
MISKGKLPDMIDFPYKALLASRSTLSQSITPGSLQTGDNFSLYSTNDRCSRRREVKFGSKVRGSYPGLIVECCTPRCW